jgi:hypothetical protein
MLASRRVRSAFVRFLLGAVASLALAARVSAADPRNAALAEERGPRATPDPSLAAELEVQAPASCATRDQLVARVVARSPRIRFVEPGGGATALRATLTPGPGGSIASELVVVPRAGRRTTRRLTASSCAEAVDALALVIAITLDPTYEAGLPAPKTDDERVTPARPPAPPQKAEHAPETSTSRDDTARPAAPSVPEPGTATLRAGAGATAGTWVGPAPRPMFAVGGYASLALDRSSLWSLAFVLSASHALAGDLVESGGVAHLTLDALTLDACPLLLRASLLEARGCATALAGWLAASGSVTYSPRSYTRPFAAAGGSLRLAAGVARHLVLSGRVGVTASLIRDAFEFSPEVFHRVEPVTLDAELGVGLRFP